MANTPIPASAIVITLEHPAWTPEDEEGNPVAAASAGDPQNFAMVEGAGFMIDGESGHEETMVEAGSVTSGGEQYLASKFRTSSARTISYICPETMNRWIQKFFETVSDDANRRPATLKETWATGQINTTRFLVSKLGNTYAKGGLLMGSHGIQPVAPTTRTRA